MLSPKWIPPRLNSEIFLFFALLVLSLASSAFNITFVYGITFNFNSIFIFLMFRIFGLRLALLTSLTAFLLVPFGYTYLANLIILLLEILFVGCYFYLKKKAKMFFVDALFWLTIGLAAILFFYHQSLTGNALYFELSKIILNGLFNVLIADMLLAYLPFYRLVKTVKLNKNNVSIHQFLSHITIISIMIPFFIFVLINALNAHEILANQSVRQAENTVKRITKQLDAENSLTEHQSKIDEIVQENTSKSYDIILTNKQNEIISSSVNLTPGTLYYLEKNYNVESINGNLYEALPKHQSNQLAINHWRSGYLVHVYEVDSQSMRIYIQFPLSQYQHDVFNNFLHHFQYSALFALFTIMFVLFINKLFMKSLSQLTTVTTGLPEKLIMLEKVDWPQSSISELRLLTQNLTEMSQKLKELFQETIDMNRVLTKQTEKLKESEDKLQELAYYDMLTSLPNRLHFQDYVRKLIINEETTCLAIMFIDLNHFKQINDTLGHDTGDLILKLTANKLRCLQGQDREVFRLGGDEFVIVQKVENRSGISETLNLIKAEFSKPLQVENQVLYITLSMGISLYPEDGKDLDTLVKCADIAMYVSKEKGGNAYQFFNDAMKGKFHERLLLENALRKAVDEKNFEIYFQPKIQCGQVTSMEALLRMSDPDLGFVSPSKFIPVAEDIGLIFNMDEWVLLEACRQNKKWQEENLLNVPVSVNLSVKNFQNTHIINMIKKALHNSGMSPEFLKIEITESVFIKNPSFVADLITQIKVLGASVSIDDFGKGFSSLNLLLQLPIDEIKIDRQFINKIDQDDRKSLLVKSIIDMAHGLNLNVVAEGIETEEEKNVLIQMGCDELQGYYFSEPLPREKILELFKQIEGVGVK